MTFADTEEYEWRNLLVDEDLVPCDFELDLGIDLAAIDSLYDLKYTASISDENNSSTLSSWRKPREPTSNLLNSNEWTILGFGACYHSSNPDSTADDPIMRYWTDSEVKTTSPPAPSCGLCVLGNLRASSRKVPAGRRPSRNTLDRCQKNNRSRRTAWSSCRSTRTLISRTSESLKGTGRWFLDHERYNQWLDQNSSFLWLCGRPGAGKSVLMSTVIHDLAKSRRPGELVVYYFANGYYRGVSTAKAILCSILGQLLLREPARISFRVVLPLLCELIEAGNVLTVTSMARIFSKIRHRLRAHETLYLLLDGLDEVTDSPAEQALVLELIDQASRHDPNHQIKCFVSSRSTFFGSRLPKGALRVDLDSHPLTRSDMSLYVQDRLHQLVFAYPLQEIKELGERVLNSASGSFLILRLILQQAGPGAGNTKANFQDFLIWLNSFSEIRLATIYGGMLGRIEDCNKEAAWSMLRWVTFAARPLELQELLALYRHTGIEIKEEDISTLSAGLLINSGNQIQFPHFSVREHLEFCLKARWAELSEEANEMIADACLKLLSTQALLQSLNLATKDFQSTEDTTSLDFVPYAQTHWIFHYKQSERSSTYLAGLLHTTLEQSLKPSEENEPKWDAGSEQNSRASRESSPPEEPRREPFKPLKFVDIALGVGARFGFTKLAGLELDMGADPNIPSGSEQQTPLCLAAKWGHLEVARLLLQRGANPFLASGSGLTPLAYAMANGHFEVQALLMRYASGASERSSAHQQYSGAQNATQKFWLTALPSPSLCASCATYRVDYELRATPEIWDEDEILPPIWISGDTISEIELQFSISSHTSGEDCGHSTVVRWFPGVQMYRVLSSVAKRGIYDVRRLLLVAGNEKENLDMVISLSKLLEKSTL